MNVCNPFLPQGLNNNCLQDLKEIKNIIITSTAASFTTPLNAATLSAWKAKVQTDLTVYAPLGVNDYDVTTDDPSVVTMNSTRKTVANRPIPSAIFYLASNFCDYKELLASLQGGNYRMFFVDSNGNIYGTKTAAGIVKGFAVQLTAISKGLPLKEAGQNFKVFANFLYEEEFKDSTLVELTWNPTIELTEASPVGLNMFTTSAITAGSITVRITARCGAGMTGLAAADFEVVESSELVTPGIATCTEGSNGDYTLTLKKATSTPLAAGDMVVIRVKKVTSTIVNYLSNRVTINALA